MALKQWAPLAIKTDSLGPPHSCSAATNHDDRPSLKSPSQRERSIRWVRTIRFSVEKLKKRTEGGTHKANVYKTIIMSISLYQKKPICNPILNTLFERDHALLLAGELFIAKAGGLAICNHAHQLGNSLGRSGKLPKC